jgi:hypothetical protein
MIDIWSTPEKCATVRDMAKELCSIEMVTDMTESLEMTYLMVRAS